MDPVLARVWRVSTEKSTHEFINWEVKKDAWIREFHEKARIFEVLSLICAVV